MSWASSILNRLRYAGRSVRGLPGKAAFHSGLQRHDRQLIFALSIREKACQPLGMDLNASPSAIEAAARAAHEANRAYCLAIGDASQLDWDEAPEWQKASARSGVLGVLAGNGPEQSHESWLKEKAATGWKFGPVKDPEKKEHPCFLPYAELPPAQKQKDGIFVGVVRAVLGAF